MHLLLSLALYLNTLLTFAPTQALGSEYKAKEATGIASETMTLLSSMATALVVKSLVTACKPMTLDMTLGAAGAGIYLVGELANLIKYRESSKGCCKVLCVNSFSALKPRKGFLKSNWVSLPVNFHS